MQYQLHISRAPEIGFATSKTSISVQVSRANHEGDSRAPDTETRLRLAFSSEKAV